VIFRVQRVDGRARVITDEERVLRGGWRDQVMQISRLFGIKEFEGERENFVLFVTMHLVRRRANYATVPLSRRSVGWSRCPGSF